MPDVLDFDSFYATTRERILLQTYALTGDLPAARSAVRDGYVAASHHWTKVSRHADPDAWVRSHSWPLAQRRATARVWHRERGLDDETAATLEALGKLSGTERKMLVLTQLTSSDLDAISREISLTRGQAEDTLQRALSSFSVHRDTPSTHTRHLLESLRAVCAEASWPRPTIIRRAGTARRRGFAGLGIAAVAIALVGSGLFVSGPGGVRPSLEAEQIVERLPGLVDLAPPAAQPPTLSTDNLLEVSQVQRMAKGSRWRAGQVRDNTAGDGVVLPCQQQRFADPKGIGALMRTYRAKPRTLGEGPEATKTPAATAVQMSELSRTPKAAERAYRRWVKWYSGCVQPQTQLVSTWDVDGVGDEASLIVMRRWGRPASSLMAGVARSGRVVTTTVTAREGAGAPPLRAAQALLAASVNRLCGTPGTRTCAAPPSARPRPPQAVGQVPGMISEVDLPPVGKVNDPWVGTQARRAKQNFAATGCARANFNEPGLSNRFTRTFLIPEAKLPNEFGLVQTSATAGARRATAFVSDFRRRFSACLDKRLGTEATQIVSRSTKTEDFFVWQVTQELSDERSVTYQMALLRSGSAVSQLGFFPAKVAPMPAGGFRALAERAFQRLDYMPKPRQTKSS